MEERYLFKSCSAASTFGFRFTRPSFFRTLKKAGPMKWTPEAEAALQDLKRYLSSTPILVAPKPQEPLLLYLATTNQVVSVALVVRREGEEVAMASAKPSDEEPRAGKARTRRGRT